MSCTWLCSVDIVLSYFREQFEEMPSVTENIKSEVWNCALIGVQKGAFLYILQNGLHFFKPLAILWNYNLFCTFLCLSIVSKETWYNATFSLKVWKYATLVSVPFLFWTQCWPSDRIFMHPNEHTSLFNYSHCVQICTEGKCIVLKMCNIIFHSNLIDYYCISLAWS